MRLRPAVWLLFCAAFSAASAQPLLQESFDTTASLPQGWLVINRAPFPIPPLANWTVRDTGIVPPGTAGVHRTKAHSLPRAIGVSWWASMDTTTGAATIADAWLWTPHIDLVRPGDGVKFWASGGSPSFLDSLEVYVTVDSVDTALVGGSYLGSIVWPVGSTFGNFTPAQFQFPPEFAGHGVRVGFRYYMNCTVNGYYVHVDDVSIETVTAVALASDGVPEECRLDQNYPNPFNGATRIGFKIGGKDGEGRVSLTVYDLLGREVARLVDEHLAPGIYTVPFDAAHLASGVYLARLSVGVRSLARRMVLMK